MTGISRGRSGLRVGVLTIVGALSFTIMFFHATNRVLGQDRATVFVRFDSADGLQRGDAVLLRGVNVGEVKSLDFDGGSVVVRVRLIRPVPLSKKARAEMVAADVFGRQSIVLRPAGLDAPGLADGDTLAGRGPVALTAKLERLGGQAGRLLGDTTIDLIRGVLEGSAATAASATGTVSDIGTLVRGADRLIAEQRESLNAITRDAQLIARQLRETSADPAMASLPGRLDRSAANLVVATETMDSAAVTLAALLADLRAGRGSAGMLLRDTALYQRTTAALASLERLLDDVRANPKRYINVRVF